MVCQISGALRAHGIGKGDRVALLSYNRIEWAASDYGILTSGATTVPLYSTLPSNQVVAGFEFNPTITSKISIEGFYKTYQNCFTVVSVCISSWVGWVKSSCAIAKLRLNFNDNKTSEFEE